MPRTCVLAIDQGTTNTKVVMFDETGTPVSSASRRMAITCPSPGWVQQDAREIWRTVAEAVAESTAAMRDVTIAAVGVTNQRESIVAWDRRSGEPVGPCIVWQCRRTAPFCEKLKTDGLDATIRAKTGLPIDPLFSASKMRWLLEHTPDGRARAAQGDLCLGTVDSWLLWNLTGGAVYASDLSNAARTQLLNLETLSWDPELLDLFGIPAGVLPQLRPSSGTLGVSVPIGSLADGVPIAALIGDSHAALFGHAAFASGAVKATYGTGTSLMTVVPTPVRSRAGLATTVAWALPGRTSYALEGNITMTGGAIEWLGQVLCFDAPAHDVATLAETAPDNGGVYLVPAFAGLGAPHWDADARGLIGGLTRGTTAAHLARATLESVAYQVRDVFDAMREDAPVELVELLADGGASANDWLMQFQADVLGCPVVRDRSGNVSARGAAWMAGLATGIWSSADKLSRLRRDVDRFEPRMSQAERTRLYAGWLRTLQRAKGAGAPHSTEVQT